MEETDISRAIIEEHTKKLCIVSHVLWPTFFLNIKIEYHVVIVCEAGIFNELHPKLRLVRYYLSCKIL